MRYRFHAALLSACLAAAAQPAGRVSDLVSDVRHDLQRQRGDSRMAKSLHKIRLLERLDDRTIETLESEGAGPETVAQLRLIRDESARLRPPAQPAIPEPPAPSPAEQARIWNAAHENSLSYTDSLPDFICSEVVRRYTDPNDKGAWRLHDTLVLKLTYFDKAEEYKLMTVNNHSTTLSYQQMGGAITEGEFGSMLAAVFALKSRTNREWDHWTTLRGRPAHVYKFSINAKNSDYQITSGTSARDEESLTTGQHGYVYVDAETQRVVRMTASADGIPPDFPVQKVDLMLDYGFVAVGAKHYLLPLHAETVMSAPPLQNRNETDFLAYKKFSADANITYEGAGK